MAIIFFCASIFPSCLKLENQFYIKWKRKTIKTEEQTDLLLWSWSDWSWNQILHQLWELVTHFTPYLRKRMEITGTGDAGACIWCWTQEVFYYQVKPLWTHTFASWDYPVTVLLIFYSQFHGLRGVINAYYLVWSFSSDIIMQTLSWFLLGKAFWITVLPVAVIVPLPPGFDKEVRGDILPPSASVTVMPLEDVTSY